MPCISFVSFVLFFLLTSVVRFGGTFFFCRCHNKVHAAGFFFTEDGRDVLII